VVATWLVAECGGQSCMAATGWHRTSSRSTALAEGYLSALSRFCGGLVRSRIKFATVLMSQSNWLLLSRVEWSGAAVLMCQSNRPVLLFAVLPSLNIIFSL
jgi:hypothetical protein